MKSSEPSFPLANRLFGVGVCSFILYLAVSPLLSADSSADWNVVSVSLLLLVVTLLLAGIGCCLFWKEPPPADEEQERLSPVDPDVLANALTCKFSTGTKSAAVFLDVDNGRAHFMNCHVPRRFLSRAEPWFSCPINELKAVYVFRYRGESLSIVTAAGKVQIPARYADQYSELREALKEIVPHNQPGYESDDPFTAFAVMGGILIGVFLGFFLTPSSAGESMMGVCMLAGGALGAFVVLLLAYLSDQLSRSK